MRPTAATLARSASVLAGPRRTASSVQARVTLPPMAFSTALVLFAHPDDAEFFCGGTVARWSREGCEVHYVCATDGSAGSNEPGTTREGMRPVREREMRAAAEILGVTSVTFLGEVDGFLEVNADTRRKVTREVRRLRPEVIVA